MKITHVTLDNAMFTECINTVKEYKIKKKVNIHTTRK